METNIYTIIGTIIAFISLIIITIGINTEFVSIVILGLLLLIISVNTVFSNS